MPPRSSVAKSSHTSMAHTQTWSVCLWSKRSQPSRSSEFGGSGRLTDICHLRFDWSVPVRPFPAQDAVKEPNDKAIYNQDRGRNHPRFHEQMMNLQRDQSRCGKHHEQLSPTLL